MAKQTVSQAFRPAREHYGVLDVNVDAAFQALATIPVSRHCWQGDDVGGFDKLARNLLSRMQPRVAADPGGDLAVTGTLPIVT